MYEVQTAHRASMDKAAFGTLVRRKRRRMQSAPQILILRQVYQGLIRRGFQKNIPVRGRKRLNIYTIFPNKAFSKKYPRKGTETCLFITLKKRIINRFQKNIPVRGRKLIIHNSIAKSTDNFQKNIPVRGRKLDPKLARMFFLVFQKNIPVRGRKLSDEKRDSVSKAFFQKNIPVRGRKLCLKIGNRNKTC